jgi:TRAP-type C4-dicarboxylate transport system permease small subunit
MFLRICKKIECGFDLLARILTVVSVLTAASITGIICVSVVMRRLANSPLYYAEELVGLLLAVTLFFALPLVTLKREHIKVTLLVNSLSQRGRMYIDICAGLVGLTFLAWLLWESVEWMSFAIRLNLKTEASSIPLVPWMSVVPFSLSLTALVLLLQIFTTVARMTSEVTGKEEKVQSSNPSNKE